MDQNPPVAASYDSGLEEESTPAQLKRQAQIAVGNELVEAQKAFHLKTAAYVMSLDHYKRIRAALSEPPDDVEDPENPWHPVQGDMLSGYPVIVRDEEGIPPHIEMVEKDMRPPYYAGVTSLGIERDDMSAPKEEAMTFTGTAEPHAPLASDEALEALRRKLMGEPDAAPAEEGVPEGRPASEAEETEQDDDSFLDAP